MEGRNEESGSVDRGWRFRTRARSPSRRSSAGRDGAGDGGVIVSLGVTLRVGGHKQEEEEQRRG